jgi:DNA-binding NarL/FixJ family response regulator
MSDLLTADTRVLIVDDHPLMRRGLAQSINDQPNLVVCGEAGSVAEALLKIDSLRPQLVVVDISMGDRSGIELVQEIRQNWPEIRVLVSSMHDETLFAERALRAGALGFVNKGEPPDVFIAALQEVNSGQIYLSKRMTNRMLHHVLADKAQPGRCLIESLSNRELQVFEMTGQGMASKQIAGKLGLRPKTIDRHREHLKRKLGLSNANELLRSAAQWDLERGHQVATP